MAKTREQKLAAIEKKFKEIRSKALKIQEQAVKQIGVKPTIPTILPPPPLKYPGATVGGKPAEKLTEKKGPGGEWYDPATDKYWDFDKNAWVNMGDLTKREVRAAAATPSPVEAPPVTPPVVAPKDSALEALKTKLLEGGGFVSSEETGFEEAISEITTGLKEAQEKTEAGIEAGFERQRIEATDIGARRKTSQLEARRGFATNTALMRQLDEQTEKSIRDLDLRKQEALSSGQMELAENLADLQLKEIEFKTTQRQQIFTNLVSLAGLELQEATGAREAEQFTTTQAGIQERFEITQKLQQTRWEAEQEVKTAQQEFDNAITLDQRRIAQENLDIAKEELKIAQDEVTQNTTMITENYLLRNIQVGATTPDDMASIYFEMLANSGLNTGEVKALMGKYGMTQSGGVWIYIPTEAAKEAGGVPPEETEEEESIWSEIWHRLPLVK